MTNFLRKRMLVLNLVGEGREALKCIIVQVAQSAAIPVSGASGQPKPLRP